MEQEVITKLPEFNYQVVYYVCNERRIVFVGVTDLTLDELLNQCDDSVNLALDEFYIESVSYSPVKSIEDGTEKK